jgi:hypothetical protein
VSTEPWSSHPRVPLTPCTGQFPRLSLVLRGGDEEAESVTWGNTVRYNGWCWWCLELLWLETHPWLPSPPSEDSFPPLRKLSKCFGSSPFFFIVSAGAPTGTPTGVPVEPQPGFQPTNRPTVCLGSTQQWPKSVLPSLGNLQWTEWTVKVKRIHLDDNFKQ